MCFPARTAAIQRMCNACRHIVSAVFFLSTHNGARWVTIGCPEEAQCVLTHTTADQSESSSVIQRMGNVSRHAVCIVLFCTHSGHPEEVDTLGKAHHDTVSTVVFCVPVPPHSLQYVFMHAQRESRGGKVGPRKSAKASPTAWKKRAQTVRGASEEGQEVAKLGKERAQRRRRLRCKTRSKPVRSARRGSTEGKIGPRRGA